MLSSVMRSAAGRFINGGGLVFSLALQVNKVKSALCLYEYNVPAVVTTVPMMRQPAHTVGSAGLTSC